MHKNKDKICFRNNSLSRKLGGTLHTCQQDNLIPIQQVFILVSVFVLLLEIGHGLVDHVPRSLHLHNLGQGSLTEQNARIVVVARELLEMKTSCVYVVLVRAVISLFDSE